MSINVQQMLALLSFKGLGTKTLQELNSLTRDLQQQEIDTPTLFFFLSKCKKFKQIKEVNKLDNNSYFERLMRIALQDAYVLIEKCRAGGVGIISYNDEIYPKILRDMVSTTINFQKKENNGLLQDKYGYPQIKISKMISNPPMLLFYRGNISIIKEDCLAIIGSRQASSHAKKAGAYLTEQFVNRGFCIVSGLAIGCDTVAHETTLSIKNGKTIAILGNGLDSIYPKENQKLADQILNQEGLLLSEYPIGIKVSSFQLVARDRIQAGLSLGTIVLQTGDMGGSLYAAINTIMSCKPLYVVKYSNDEFNVSEQTRGNHMLVEKYGAKWIEASKYPNIMKFNLDNIANELRE